MRARPTAVTSVLAAACAALSLASPGCKREPRTANAPPPSGAAAPATDDGREGPVFTVDATDLPGPQDPPLRVVFGSRAGVAWVVRRSDGLHVVHAGKVGRAVLAVDKISLGPDGDRIAYSAAIDGEWRMIVNADVSALSGSVEEPVFSPDGRHVAYFVSAADGTRLVVDGSEGPKRQQRPAGAPVFSADSRLVAFADGAGPGLPKLAVSDLSFSQVTAKASGVKEFIANDARTALAAVIEDRKKQRVVIIGFSRDGTAAPGPSYDAVSRLAFAPDGAAVAYVAERDGKRFLVFAGKESPLPEGEVTSAPAIRPDGRVGVLMAAGDGHFLHEAFAGAAAGDARRYDEAADLAYAAAGASAFSARRGDSWFVVVNGHEGPPFDRVVTPTFSPDGKVLAYRARKEGQRFAVIADATGGTLRQLPAFEQVFPLRFAPDGKSITYGVKDGPRIGWKVEPL